MTTLEKLRMKTDYLLCVIKKAYATLDEDAHYALADQLKNDFCLVESALRAVEDEQRWIPVEERLPEKYKDVLIVCRSEIGIALGRLVVIGFDSLKWEIYGVDDPVPLIAVTHWRPLLEGPEEGIK